MSTRTAGGSATARSIRPSGNGAGQDTGFSRHPCRPGLLTFRAMDEAVDGAERVCATTKALPGRTPAGEEYFDSNKVIAALAAEIGLKLP